MQVRESNHLLWSFDRSPGQRTQRGLAGVGIAGHGFYIEFQPTLHQSVNFPVIIIIIPERLILITDLLAKGKLSVGVYYRRFHFRARSLKSLKSLTNQIQTSHCTLCRRCNECSSRLLFWGRGYEGKEGKPHCGTARLASGLYRSTTCLPARSRDPPTSSPAHTKFQKQQLNKYFCHC